MASADKVNIIHPIFDECKNYTLDGFWKEHFSNFAANRFPVGVRYDANHGNLILKIDGKSEIVALPRDDVFETFGVIMKVLRDKLGFRSTRDLKIQRQNIEDNLDEQRQNFSQDYLTCEWKKIRPRHLKDQLVMDYIANLQHKHSLIPSEVKHLTSVVQLGFQFRSLTADDVVYADGVISDIRNLKFSKTTRKFTTPPVSVSSKSSDKTSKSQDPFYYAFDKFLKEDALRVAKIKGC